DITSGKFVFSASEAYLIEDGKIGPAVKGATLIGNGPDAVTKITMIGNDLRLDDGVGTCGKDGQGVPVGVGQPTRGVEGLTVGGAGAWRRPLARPPVFLRASRRAAAARRRARLRLGGGAVEPLVARRRRRRLVAEKPVRREFLQPRRQHPRRRL